MRRLWLSSTSLSARPACVAIAAAVCAARCASSKKKKPTPASKAAEKQPAAKAKATATTTAKKETTPAAGSTSSVSPPPKAAAPPTAEPESQPEDPIAHHGPVRSAQPPIRGFNLEKVLAEKTEYQDIVLAKQEGPSVFSFVAYPGHTSQSVAARLLDVPEAQRHLHTVFARPGSPCDLVLDLDFDLCSVPKSDAGYYTGEGILLQTLEATQKCFAERFKVAKPVSIVVLDGNSQRKHSYHIHVRSDNIAFRDFTGARDVAAYVNKNLPFPAVDMGVYRANGTMRVAFTPKFTEATRLLTPLRQPSDKALKPFLAEMMDMSDVDIIERSLVTRTLTYNDAARASIKLMQASRGSGVVEYDDTGAAVIPFMQESKKWVRFGEAVQAVKRLPLNAAEDYNIWVRVGLALFSFGNDPHIFQTWNAFSVRCPSKYDPQLMHQLWTKYFPNRPNCYSWRRGYNYLTGSLRKQLGLPRQPLGLPRGSAKNSN